MMHVYKKHFLNIALLCAAALVLGVLIVSSLPSRSPEQQIGCTQEARLCPDGTSVGRSGPNCAFAPCPVTQPTVYENDFLKVMIPDGWTAKEARQTVYEGSTETHPLNPAAVNITKGNYILYINAAAQQASGVEGGRFAEIAMGAPSADAVVTYQPSEPCGASETSPVLKDHERVDWYISEKDAQDWCATPSDGSTVWYFSYVTHTGGYINYYIPDTPPGYVITMAYNSNTVNDLPQKGNPELQKALADMTASIDSLILKKN